MAAKLGPELWTFGDAENFTVDGFDSIIGVTSGPIVAGKIYRIKYDYEGIGNTIRRRIASQVLFMGSGSFDGYVLAGLDDWMYFQNNGSTGNTGSIRNISVRELLNPVGGAGVRSYLGLGLGLFLGNAPVISNGTPLSPSAWVDGDDWNDSDPWID